MIDSAEAVFAIQAVRRASQMVREVQKEMISPALTKEDRSPVTVGDFAAQAVVARLLEQVFPTDSLVGEECADALRTNEERETLEQVTQFVSRQISGASAEDVCDWIDRGTAPAEGRFWTLDPIDGTKGFLRGDQYAVCLALIEEGVVKLGVLGCPNLTPAGTADVGGPGALFCAAQGEGTWSAPLDSVDDGESSFTRMEVSDRQNPTEARMLRSVESGHTHGGKIEELVQTLDVQADPVRMDSQAKYAVLACGGGDLLVRLLSPSRPDYREMIWDQAAGMIVVHEAGGRVTDLSGKPLDFGHGRTLAENRGVLASNGNLHDRVLAGLKRVEA